MKSAFASVTKVTENESDGNEDDFPVVFCFFLHSVYTFSFFSYDIIDINMATISKLIEKTQDYDSAERYMATTDLCNLLGQESFKLDGTTEKLVVTAILKQLDDKNNDVQSVAVKCLAILLKKVQEEQVGDICEKLCILILQEGQAMLRDIYSIGLKTLITDVPDKMGDKVSSKLTTRLLNGISAAHHDDIRRECLENLAELLRRFGHLIVAEHEEIMTSVLIQLDNPKAIIRKKAAICLGSLAVVSSDALLNRLLERLLELIDPPEPSTKSSDTRTLIQTIGTISRTVGYRLGRHLDRLIPLIIRFCGDPNDESQQNDAANELREHCFPAIESFVLRCPREVTPYLDHILSLSFAFMKYDPNYSYCEEDDNAMDEDNEQEEEDEGYGGSDDDDTSWKVRKAAIKVISAVVTARPDMLSKLYQDYIEVLVGRFKEREENVRLDVLHCLGSMLQASLVSNGAKSDSETGMRSQQGMGIGSLTSFAQGIPLVRTRSTRDHLFEKSDQIIIAARKQLQCGTVKSKSPVFSLLRTLTQVTHGHLNRHLKDLVGDFIKCMSSEKNQTLKLDALLFLHALFEYHPAEVMQPHIPAVLPHILGCIKEDWYKIIAEALRVLGAVIVAARPVNSLGDMFVGSSDQSAMAHPSFYVVLSRLEVHDIDQEIKECAISTMGKLFVHFGDELKEQLPIVLGLLRRRMENDTTRNSTLKSLDMMAHSPLALDLSPVLQQSSVELSHFLRQQSRVLKQQALITLDSLVRSPSAQLSDELCKTILVEAANLVSDSDLHLAHLALTLTQGIISKQPSAAGIVFTHIYRPSIELSQSPLLQGHSLRSLVAFLQDLVILRAPSMTFQDIFSALYHRAVTSSTVQHNGLGGASSSQSTVCSGKQSVSNLATCIAGVCMQVDSAVRNTVVAQLASDLAPGDEGRRHLALLCIGELGQSTDLASTSADLKSLILSCFDSSAEETKTAAAYALGHLAVGNIPTYLPAILQSIPTSKHQYLLLASLKEIMLVHADKGIAFTAFLEDVLAALRPYITAEEEGVRNMVAECLGIATFMHPEGMMPLLIKLLDESPTGQGLAAWTVTTALRFALTRPVSNNGLPTFQDVMRRFIPVLASTDLEVRKAALLLINTAVYYNSSVLRDSLENEINPQLIDTLKFKQERTVDLGPFKHKVDDGLPLRKVALTCIETMLDFCKEKMDLSRFLHAIVASSMADDSLKMQAHQVG